MDEKRQSKEASLPGAAAAPKAPAPRAPTFGKPLTSKTLASTQPLTGKSQASTQPLTSKMQASTQPLTGKSPGVSKPLATQPIRRVGATAAGATTLASQANVKPTTLSSLPKLAISPAATEPETQAQVEPAVLAIGTDDGILLGLKAALARHGVFVESADAPSVVDAVLAAAPDLILLLGEAARDGGRATLEKLSASPQCSVIPVAIIDDNMALNARLQAFRHGATAVIARSASIDAIADKVARLAKEIPDRGTDSPQLVGEATLEEFIDALRSQLRTGILSVNAAKGPPEQAIRLVLGGGKLLADFVDDFVRRVRTHVVSAEPLTYEFDERAGGTVGLLGSDAKAAAAANVRGLRLALADEDAARADTVAQDLRSHGAQVFVTDLSPSELRLARLRQLDPAVLLIGESHLKGEGYELIRRMRRDTRLRWASLLVLRWDELDGDQGDAPLVERLAGTLATLVEPERSLLERTMGGTAFDTRLETTGPARLLKALQTCPHPLRLTTHNARVVVSIDLSDGLIVGASAQVLSPVPAELSGPVALAAFLVLSSGRVHVEKTAAAAQMNIMATADVAMNLAEAEPPPISPSIPAPSRSVEPTQPAPFPAPSKLPELRPYSLPPAAEAESPNSTVQAQSVAFNDETIDQELVRAGLWQPRGVRRALSWKHWVLLPLLAALQLAVLAGVGVAAMRYLQKEPVTAKQPKAGPAAAAPEPKRAAPATTEPARAEAVAAAEPARAQAAPGAPEVDADVAPTPVVPAGVVPLFLPKPTAAPTCAALMREVGAPQGTSVGAAILELAQGHKQLVKGNVDAAQTAFCRATELDHDNAKAQLALAQLLVLRGDGPAAASVARRALALRAEPTRAQGLLGDALIAGGDLDGARQAWLEATGTAKDDAAGIDSLSQRARSEAEHSIRNKDYARAERFFWRTLAFLPQDFASTSGMALSHLYRGDNEAAAIWAERATQIGPADPRAHVIYGDALLRKGDRKAAIVAWEQAKRLDPSNLEVKTRLEK